MKVLKLDSIAPSVLIDGQTYHPPGWMYVLALAVRGVQWAIETADKPGFREMCRLWLDVHRSKDFSDGEGI